MNKEPRRSIKAKVSRAEQTVTREPYLDDFPEDAAVYASLLIGQFRSGVDKSKAAIDAISRARQCPDKFVFQQREKLLVMAQDAQDMVNEMTGAIARLGRDYHVGE